MSSPIRTYPTKKTGVGNAGEVTGTDISGDKRALDVNVANTLSFTPAPQPTGPFEISIATVTDTAADPLVAPFPNRASLSIRNKSATVTIFFGKDASVSADDTSTGGWEIGPGEDFNIDLDDSNLFYLVAPTGQSAVVKIFEIASS